MFSEITVGSRDVQIKVREFQDHDGKAGVNLSGFVIHSSCTIRSIRVVEEPEARRVLMRIGPVRPGETGAFDIDVPVDDNVDRIYIGSDSCAIWQQEADASKALTAVPLSERVP